MPDKSKSEKKKRKRSGHRQTPSPGISTPRHKGQRLLETGAEGGSETPANQAPVPSIAEELENAFSDDGGSVVGNSTDSGEDDEMEVLELTTEKVGPDIDNILAMLAENNARMTEAAPWACGLVSIIETLCLKVKALEGQNISLRASLVFAHAENKKQDGELKTCRDDVDNLSNCYVKMGQVTSNHGVTIEALQERAVKLDTTQRSNNLIFRGIAEDGRNTADECLKKRTN